MLTGNIARYAANIDYLNDFVQSVAYTSSNPNSLELALPNPEDQNGELGDELPTKEVSEILLENGQINEKLLRKATEEILLSEEKSFFNSNLDFYEVFEEN